MFGKTALLRDPGAHHRRRRALDEAPLPPGLTPVDDQGNPEGGSCGDNGDINGPCVDHVLFTDQRHGYLWSFHSFYLTVDGGATWADEHSRARDVVRADHSLLRLRVLHDCSSPCVFALERSVPGSATWTSITLPGKPPMENAQLVSGGGVLYLSLPGFPGPPASQSPQLYRSADDGASWHDLGDPCPGDAVLLNAAPDGGLAVECTHARTVRVIDRDRGSFGPARPGPASPDGAHGEAVTASSSAGLWWCQKMGLQRYRGAWSCSRSDDGGGHWVKNDSILQPPTFTSASYGFAPTAAGTKLAITTDGGRTFRAYPFS